MTKHKIRDHLKKYRVTAKRIAHKMAQDDARRAAAAHEQTKRSLGHILLLCTLAKGLSDPAIIGKTIENIQEIAQTAQDRITR